MGWRRHSFADAVGRRGTALVFASAVVVLAILGWAMANVTYDVWGAFIVIPVAAAATYPLLKRTLTGELRGLLPIALVGLAAKFIGSFARYYVAFDAYGGAADAGRYHTAGKLLAGDVWAGRASLFAVIPGGTGTAFIDRLTGLVYTLFGSSRLGGFMWFSVMGYWGVVFCVKAACIAVPGLDARRYAWLCFLMPSLVFWPSSIGKEAFISLCLGVLSLGAARLFIGEWSVVRVAMIGIGALGAGLVRPHFAFIWLGGVTLALATAFIRPPSGGRPAQRWKVALVLAAGAATLTFVAKVTLRFVNPQNDATETVSNQVTGAFDVTARRSSGGNSAFAPPSLSTPLDYPFAVVRTLTRPLLTEASGLSTLLPALEMTFLLALALVSWRRFASLPRMLARSPYVVYSLLVCIMFGVAFSRLGNLAILVRQRSLVMPLMLVLWCLPPVWRAKVPPVHQAVVEAAPAQPAAGGLVRHPT